jgi:hypothetical protein
VGPILISLPVLVARILNEEKVLVRDLPGYVEYQGEGHDQAHSRCLVVHYRQVNVPTRTKITIGRSSASLKSGVSQSGQKVRCMIEPLSALATYSVRRPVILTASLSNMAPAASRGPGGLRGQAAPVSERKDMSPTKAQSDQLLPTISPRPLARRNALRPILSQRRVVAGRLKWADTEWLPQRRSLSRPRSGNQANE